MSILLFFTDGAVSFQRLGRERRYDIAAFTISFVFIVAQDTGLSRNDLTRH